jgi:hypothetical protein
MFETIWMEKRLRSISRRLTQFDLQRPDPNTEDFSSNDIEQYLSGKLRSNDLFLNYYSKQGLIDALSRYGTFERLRNKGFDPHLSLHGLDSGRHILRVRDGVEGPLIIELVSRFVSLKVRNSFNRLAAGEVLELLAIEWLLLQNPRRQFDENKPRLPGQKFPGSGIGREIMTLLKIMTERLEREGMLAFPEHYHNGLLYDREFLYFSPEREGELKALERDLSGLTLGEASWAVEKRLVIEKQTGKPYRWRGEEMIWPASDRLKEYFNSGEYRETVDRIISERHYIFDPEKVKQIARDP